MKSEQAEQVGRVSPSGVTRQAAESAANENVGLRCANPTYAGDWMECTLGEFVRLQRGHDLTASEQKPGKIPVMGSAGQNGTHSEAKASGPGVVIGRRGASMGRLHFSKVNFWPHNTCLYVTDFLGNSPRFAYYVLQTLDLAAYNSGSAQPSLNRNYIYSMRLQLPPRREQDNIVELLEALDDRIALLRETNATLEATAQALFKSWFVDFDPVRAKQQGIDPEGMNAATAALFPTASRNRNWAWCRGGGGLEYCKTCWYFNGDLTCQLKTVYPVTSQSLQQVGRAAHIKYQCRKDPGSSLVDLVF